MRAVVVGAGAVGARAARQLLFLGPVDDLAVIDSDPKRAAAVVSSLGAPSLVLTSLPPRADVVVLASPGPHLDMARRALEIGASVVSVGDAEADVEGLLGLDALAREAGRYLVVGAGFSPGLSCVLAAHAARSFERVDEVHVAKMGTGGPACATQHHRALAGPANRWHDGAWERTPGASGRELVWFPDPVGGVDCYRAALSDPLLLVPAFPGVGRVSARLGASRRDRLTARLPMLRRPHPEGVLGAIRVEVRGSQGVATDHRVLGVVDRPAVAAGVVAAVAARWAVDGRLTRTGAAGLATLSETGPFLAVLAERGVKAAVFEGAGRA